MKSEERERGGNRFCRCFNLHVFVSLIICPELKIPLASASRIPCTHASIMCVARSKEQKEKNEKEKAMRWCFFPHLFFFLPVGVRRARFLFFWGEKVLCKLKSARAPPFPFEKKREKIILHFRRRANARKRGWCALCEVFFLSFVRRVYPSFS